MQNEIKQKVTEILQIQSTETEYIRNYVNQYIQNRQNHIDGQELLNLMKIDFVQEAEAFFYLMQLMTWIMFNEDNFGINSQSTQEIILNISIIYDRLKQQKPKYQEVIINFLHNLLIKTKKFICINKKENQAIGGNFFNEIIKQLVQNEKLLLLLTQINIKYEQFTDIVEALSYIDEKVEIQLSDSLIEQLRDYLSEQLMIIFSAQENKQLDYLNKYMEINIPFIQQSRAKLNTQINTFAEDIEDIGPFIQEQSDDDTNIIQHHIQSCRYLTEQCIRFYHEQAKNVFSSLNHTIQLSDIINNAIEQVSYVLQILEQYLSIQSSAWKSKIVCQYFYTHIAFIIHYNFQHQDKKKAGRFNYFFGREIEKLRCTIIFVLANMTHNCPCAWDLIRIFKLLEQLCIGMMGDGYMAGIKEVCQMTLTYACDYCETNIEYLEQLKDNTAARVVIL